MYVSGALSKLPGSAIAITASAFGNALAVSVVPSSGSRAMSMARPPVPTFSPMKSIGASSRSPSPITTVPEIGKELNAERMASTAARSAACSSPRPICTDAAMAAASVTRTASSAKARSNGLLVMPSPWAFEGRSGGLHGNHARTRANLVRGGDHLQGALNGKLRCVVGDHDDRDQLAIGAATMDHAFDGNARLGKMDGDIL